MAKGGFPNFGNMQQLAKQAQRMQQDLARVQDEVAQKEFEVSVGGGAVKATITGAKVFKSFNIDPSCIDPDDVEMLQDLIMSAANEAIRVADDEMNKAVSSVTGGINIGL